MHVVGCVCDIRVDSADVRSAGQKQGGAEARELPVCALRAGPHRPGDATRELIYDFDLLRGPIKGIMNIRVFTDGTFDMREMQIVFHSQPGGGVGCDSDVGLLSGALRQRACPAQERQCRHRQLSNLCGVQVQQRCLQAATGHIVTSAKSSGS